MQVYETSWKEQGWPSAWWGIGDPEQSAPPIGALIIAQLTSNILPATLS